MKVYLAYRYSKPANVLSVLQNIGKAVDIGHQIAQVKGCYPYIPHLDCLVAMRTPELPLEYYYTCSMEWLKTCDVMYLADPDDITELESVGVTKEFEYCRDNSIPVVSTIPDLRYVYESFVMYGNRFCYRLGTHHLGSRNRELSNLIDLACRELTPKLASLNRKLMGRTI